MAQEITSKKQDLAFRLNQAEAMRPLSELQELGRVFYESGMFPDIRSAAQAIVKIQAGGELGFPPIYSMAKIYIVKGRVMVGAEALGAMVKRSGRYDYRVVKLTDTECELMFTDKGFSLKVHPGSTESPRSEGQDVFLSRFTIEDARRADLLQPGSGWYKWPRAMLISKALSQGARIVCPHMISGVYVPEDFGIEMGDEGEIETAEPLTAEPVTTSPKVDTSAPVNNPVIPEPTKTGTGITDRATPAQIRKIMAQARSKGCPISDIGSYMRIKWHLSSTKELTRSQAGELTHLIEAGQIAFSLDQAEVSLVQNMLQPGLDLPAKSDIPDSVTPSDREKSMP